jgi:hypothetical protein
VSAIDSHVTALGRRLVGPARLKRDVLTEARDSLVDAAAAYEDAGLPPDDAQRRAVADFGSVARIAPAYQAEVAATYGQRLAGLVTALLLTTALLGDRMWQGAPWTGIAPPGGYATAARALDWLGYLGIGTAAAGFLALRLRARRGHSGRVVRVVGYATAAALSSVLLLGAGVYVSTVAIYPGALTWPPMLVGGILLSGMLGYLAWGASRCLAAARAVA